MYRQFFCEELDSNVLYLIFVILTKFFMTAKNNLNEFI